MKEQSVNDTRQKRCLTLGIKEFEIHKVKTKDVYQWLISLKFKTPSSHDNVSKRMNSKTPIDWQKVYNRIYQTSIDTYSRYFQYKILNNILYLNRDLHRFKIIDVASCSFCFCYPETIDHFFVDCVQSKQLYFQIKNWLEKVDIALPKSNRVDIILARCR